MSADDVTKALAKRIEIADRLADFILAEGLPGASLRPLGAAAGMSDRMLLYYFKDKEDILGTALARIAARLGERLMALGLEGARAPKALEDELIDLATSAHLWPYMCVWLETASLAARGDPLCRAVGGQIASGFRSWISSLLAAEDDVARDAAAVRVLRAVEGAIVLHGVGLGAGTPQALAGGAG